MTDTRTPLDRITPSDPAQDAQRRQSADAHTLVTFRNHVRLLRSVYVKDGTETQRREINLSLRRLRSANLSMIRHIEELTAAVLDRGLEAPDWLDNPAAIPETTETGPLTSSEQQWVQNTFHERSPRDAQEADVRRLAKLAAKVKGNDGALLVESKFGPIADFWADRVRHRNNRTAGRYDAPDISDFEGSYAEIVADLTLGSVELQESLPPNTWEDIDRRKGAARRFAASEFAEMLEEQVEPFAVPTQTHRPDMTPQPDPVAEAAERGRERARQRHQGPNPLERMGLEQ